ncbi:ribonuclease E inhibitor RraA/Dimethylmenaquinone methyltransferase [Scheffersomyces xylosifermentans]|uniref:ribonuclease E inhibitor RraA/Dimethylmenaquinone methyltransferase n=1 Tax=Scheffersomyces xylosifermentans TaxID=1304137 RepID=UPI00315DB614
MRFSLHIIVENKSSFQIESSFQIDKWFLSNCSSLTWINMSVSKKLAQKEVISLLSNFTPCDVSDSLNKHGIADGGFIPNLVNRSPLVGDKSSAVGKAFTVLYAPKSDPRPAIKGSYIDIVPPGSIVVLGLPLEAQLINAPYVKVNNALYGGLMSTRAKYLGANGSVILGRIRDLDEHNDLEYPVWSYGVGTSAPGPLVKVVGIDVPLQVKVPTLEESKPEQVLTINPGDYIIADKNGVVRLPDDDKLESVLDYIPKRVDADTKVAADIKSGKPAKESQDLWRSKI